MIRNMGLLVILLTIILVVSACGGNEPAATIDEDTISIEVTNSTEDIIISWAAFFGPGLDEWGEDLLGDQVIEPGETYQFILPEGEYNMALFTYELYVLYSDWGINSDINIEVGGEGQIPILVENTSEKDIALFFISPSDSDDWGEDWLGDTDVIIAETGGRIFFVQPDTYDLMAIDVDGEVVFDVREMEIDSRRVFIVE